MLDLVDNISTNTHCGVCTSMKVPTFDPPSRNVGICSCSFEHSPGLMMHCTMRNHSSSELIHVCCGQLMGATLGFFVKSLTVRYRIAGLRLVHTLSWAVPVPTPCHWHTQLHIIHPHLHLIVGVGDSPVGIIAKPLKLECASCAYSLAERAFPA